MERPRILTAYHSEYSNRFSKIKVLKRKPIDEGSESKERITGVVSTQTNERHVSLIRRNFDDRFPYNTPLNKITATQTKESWRRYKKSDQPTYGTLRIAQDGSLLVTDVCADGSRCYGNPDFLKNLRAGKLLRCKKDNEIDTLFIKLVDSEQIELIRHKADGLVRNASDNKIGLPLNDPIELVVHPDGKWDILTLDVAETHFKDNIYDTELFNDKCTEYFIAELYRTCNELKLYRQKSLYQKLRLYMKNKIKKIQHEIFVALKTL